MVHQHAKHAEVEWKLMDIGSLVLILPNLKTGIWREQRLSARGDFMITLWSLVSSDSSLTIVQPAQHELAGG